MSNQMNVDLGRLPQHAAEHQAVAAAWKEWAAGAEGFLAGLRHSHGVVAEPVIRVLEAYQQRRASFAGDQADINQAVSDAIVDNLVDYRTREADSRHGLAASVRGI